MYSYAVVNVAGLNVAFKLNVFAQPVHCEKVKINSILRLRHEP